ncbi:HEPN domain-containing protein [Ruegeria sp. R14_0]|uniref:HEPN domain-containing protein n=1 Tax=Ruegeria sp. R14_0 TaxID=2821100 RepID=UPI001ADA51D6|nr:HEPN domain-containing protein [Ruegeria sp. R14_0]MBO9448367.1 hypothetical protein [Ruegeria sp. R14_0]
MLFKDFDQTDWTKRLSTALSKLERAQRPFLDWYFSATGYTRIVRNGRDETPYPSEAIQKLYDDALFEARYKNTENFKKLKAAIDPVRGVLRYHPTLSRTLGNNLGRDEFQVGILNHTSMTTLSQLIVGLMEAQDESSNDPFLRPASDLNTILKLAIQNSDGETQPYLGKAIDVALYHGVFVENTVELGEGYSLVPFEQLQEHIEPEWLTEVAAKQVNWRRLEAVFGIARQFSWKPRFGDLHNPPRFQTRNLPPLFHRWATEFANLLSITLSQRVSWLATFEGCIPRRASGLLGSHHDSAQTHSGRSISHLFSAFDEIEAVDIGQILSVKDLFARRRETEYPEMAAIIQRLAESHRRDGRFSTEDKILDLAIVFERLFKPRGRSLSRDLEKAAADLLATNDVDKASIREKMRHFYKVRSAIVHGPSDNKRRRLISQAGQAWEDGEPIARAAILKRIH